MGSTGLLLRIFFIEYLTYVLTIKAWKAANYADGYWFYMLRNKSIGTFSGGVITLVKKTESK